MGNASRHDRSLACGGAARRKAALGRLHHPDEIAVAPHGEMGGEVAVVRALTRRHAVELKLIAPDRDGLAGLELRDALQAPLRLADDAEQRDAEPEMRKGGAPGRARKPLRACERGS